MIGVAEVVFIFVYLARPMYTKKSKIASKSLVRGRGGGVQSLSIHLQLSFIRKPKAEKISAGSLCPAYNMYMDGKEISRVPVGSCMLPDCYSV